MKRWWYCGGATEEGRKRQTSENRTYSFNHSRRELPGLRWCRSLVVAAERSVFRGTGEEDGGRERRWGRIGIRICTWTKSRPTTRHPTVCSIGLVLLLQKPTTHHPLKPLCASSLSSPKISSNLRPPQTPLCLPLNYSSLQQRGETQTRQGASPFTVEISGFFSKIFGPSEALK